MDASDKFSHMVYFKLRDNSRDACEKLVSACKQHLTDHPGTLFFAAGVLADTKREVNDRGFDVALNLIFADKAAHDAYQVATRHDTFIAENKSNWEQVRVFDAFVS